MDDGLLAALEDGGYLLTTTSGGADRMEAWLRDRIDRRGYRVHVLPADRGARRDQRRGPARARPAGGALATTTSPATRSPTPGTPTITVAGVPCRALAVGFVGEIELRAPPPAVAERRALGRAARGRARVGRPPPRPRRARRPAAGEGPHLPGAGHAARRPPGEARPGLGGGDGQTGVRRQGLAGTDGGAPARTPARRAPVRRHRRSAVRRSRSTAGSSAGSRRARTPPPSGRRSVSAGSAPSTARSRRVLASGDLRATVTPTPFYDPEGVRLRA